ncbi:transcription-repair-coupling factor [Siccirubricoccus deserti]|uniref:Transcription-repair-coupling factor n=1 Tax=Siccirubricoccus deserti TaxID=2013562 RepID=A0A9X0R021_9PROT|nr:DEAD/DEAH box helicase [Siccirubricoccus deserti]MBC4017045.1 DEAD/DEAH box helicase [Siccirubricoccus deserti]GGC56577.1 transcription-repair-coupling factor [Siccirubricoccus deserti]
MLNAEPEGLLAARLVEGAAAGGRILFVARSEARAARLHQAVRALSPAGLEVLFLPAWDCLPYDRVSPSRAVMGQRMAVAAALIAGSTAPRLLIGSVAAMAQRLPRPDTSMSLQLERGAALDPEALRRKLLRRGYVLDDRADAPGEAVLHGSVVDIMLAGAPGGPAWRLRHEAGRLLEIHRFDPLSQRSLEEETAALVLGPASELVLPPDHPLAEVRPPGLEHALPAFCEDLVTLLALWPEATVILDDGASAALERRWAEVGEAFRTRIALRPPRPEEPSIPPPEALHLDPAAWSAALGGRVPQQVAPPGETPPVPPRFAALPDPEAELLGYASAQREQGRRLLLAGPARRGLHRLARRLGEALDIEAQPVADWPALLRLPPGSLAWLEAPADLPGFEAAEAVLLPLAALRPGGTARQAGHGAEALMAATASLQPGDAVIHFDHGLGALRGVMPVETGAAQLDCLRLDYADAAQIVPFDELDRLWRYGAEAAGLSLDRLGGEAWPKRRAEAEAAVAESAQALLKMVRAREAARAPALRPPQEVFARLAARFPYELTEDQDTATAAVLADLAAGRPMDRLVCGDVGFGKTEVALRAAAAAALSGHQVALLAPTTVLVRQHLESFRRRFEGLGIRVEALSRLTPPAEARAIRAAIAKGEVQIAIGTQALAAKSVRFHNLALLIIDEEQRFGVQQKAQLQRLRATGTPHVLTLTATPIPRTLQAALVGLRDLSVIATPPARRQPVRTLRAPLADALLAQALRREARRGGQSFVVCPRIEDVAPMRDRIAGQVPELSVVEAHGGLPPDEVDAAMLRFADGEADVLVSTNIVETGLDVPRANTMLVWRADRFGLSQLHQLRGRVGRGRERGAIYLLTDPAVRLAAATDRRLRTLEALDRVGAGFAISARDLDLRGAGDLLGDAQAGHLKLVGIELYRHLLDRALAVARGEAPPEAWSPAVALGVDAYVPTDHVPEEAQRVEVHARLARLLRDGDMPGVEALEDELEDRFGPPPEPLRGLFALARISVRCRRLGIARIEVGPSAAAATLRQPPAETPPGLELRNGRLLQRRETTDAAQRVAAAEALLAALAPARRRHAA